MGTMDSTRRINRIRKRVTKSLTGNLGKSAKRKRGATQLSKESVKHILICRPNHRLGNQLLISPLVQEVSDIFPDATIDLFVKGGAASIVFRNYEKIDRIIQLPKKHFNEPLKYLQGWFKIRSRHYDIVINASKNSSSGRLSTKFARSGFKIFGDDEPGLRQKYPDYRHLAKYPVYDLRKYLSESGIEAGEGEIRTISLKLSPEEIAAGRVVLQKYLPGEGKSISLFTYATGAKCYTPEWWEEFYGKVKAKFSDYRIIEILPVENVSQIGFREPAYYSRDVREMAAVIANTDIFIGADSGIMHLSSSSQTPTIGFFSVTDPENYGPYGNNSLGIDTNKHNIDYIISEIEKRLR